VEKLKREVAVLRKAVDDPSPNVGQMASKMLKARQNALLARQRRQDICD
jgi:hypothetical protein